MLARIQRVRSGAISLPVSRSEAPPAYESAVSMKLTPASRAATTMRAASASSVRSPNIMVPRQIGETRIPEAPSFLYTAWQFP